MFSAVRTDNQVENQVTGSGEAGNCGPRRSCLNAAEAAKEQSAHGAQAKTMRQLFGALIQQLIVALKSERHH